MATNQLTYLHETLATHKDAVRGINEHSHVTPCNGVGCASRQTEEVPMNEVFDGTREEERCWSVLEKRIETMALCHLGFGDNL